MRKFLMFATTALISISSANAAIIYGSISIDGTDQYTNDTVTFIGNGNIGAATAAGDFSPAFDPGCNNCVNLNNFNFVNPSVPEVIYSATLNGQTTTFTLNSISDYSVGNKFLNIDAVGTVSLTGFDTTPAEFAFSSQGGQNKNVTFSATTDSAPVPEPASIALLGLGMIGFGIYRRRSFN